MFWKSRWSIIILCEASVAWLQTKTTIFTHVKLYFSINPSLSWAEILRERTWTITEDFFLYYFPLLIELPSRPGLHCERDSISQWDCSVKGEKSIASRELVSLLQYALVQNTLTQSEGYSTEFWLWGLFGSSDGLRKRRVGGDTAVPLWLEEKDK